MAGALFFVTCSILEPLEARICLKIGSQCLSKGGVFAPMCSDLRYSAAATHTVHNNAQGCVGTRVGRR